MIYITDSPVVQQDGQKYTKYFGTAKQVSAVYGYKYIQDNVSIKNLGSNDITVIVNGITITVNQNRSYLFTNVLTFTITASVGKQEFLVESWVVNGFLEVKSQGFVYNADIGLRRWKAQLARVKAVTNQIINLNFVGDSITEGENAGGGAGIGDRALIPTLGYVGRIRSALNAKYGNVGTGFMPPLYPNSKPVVAFAGTGTWTSPAGLGTANIYQRGTTGCTATYTFTGTGVGFVYYKGPNAGTISYTIDGGAATNITANNVTAVVGSTEVTGLANASHTIVITNTDASLILYFLGVYAINGTAGVRVNTMARAGTQTSDHVQANSLDILSQFPASLTVIALGANDYQNGMPLATYIANLTTIMNRGLLTGDVLFVSAGIRLDPGSAIMPQVNYANAMRDVALANNCAYIDLFNRWGGDGIYVRDTLGFYSDTLVHPNDYGHQDYATAILKVIDEY